MAESRNRTLLRRLLKKILKDDRVATPAQSGEAAYFRAYRRNLKGNDVERTSCIKKANEYLSLLKITPESKRSLPPSLNNTVSECRKIAGSIRLKCTARMQAVEKLLFLESIDVPQTDEPTWQFMHRELGTAPPVKPLSPTLIHVRIENRRQAFFGIVECFRADREAGLITTLSEVERALRLPEMPAVVKADSAELYKEELQRQRFLDSL